MAEGKTLEETRRQTDRRDFDEKWGKGFIKPDKFVGLVYDSLP